MARAEYESFTTNTQTSDVSFQNLTLSNVGVSDDESVTSEKRIKFNKVATKEILKHMSKTHLCKHIDDVTGDLKCHEIKSNLTSSYLKGPSILTRNKLYSILYLGLLITQSDLQLGDLLRYCREGHVSYLSYNHFFPETFSEKQIDAVMYQLGRKIIPTHENIRQTSQRLFHMMKLTTCDLSPNILKLCERYCKELNLPGIFL